MNLDIKINGFTKDTSLRCNQESFALKYKKPTNFRDYPIDLDKQINKRILNNIEKDIVDKFSKEFENVNNHIYINMIDIKSNINILYTLPYKNYLVNRQTHLYILTNMNNMMFNTKLGDSIIENNFRIGDKELLVNRSDKMPDGCVFAFESVKWNLENINTHVESETYTFRYDISLTIENPTKIWILTDTSSEPYKNYRIMKRKNLIEEIINTCKV